MSAKRARFRVGQRVYDKWWPEREGEIIRVGKTRTRVRWLTDEQVEESYDLGHLQFLRPAGDAR